MTANALKSLTADYTPPGGGRTFLKIEESPQNMGFCLGSDANSTTQIDGTKRETDAGTRGKSGDFDPRLFRHLARALSRQSQTQETVSVRLSLLELAANPGSASAMAGLRKNFAALEAVQRQSPPGSQVD